MRKQGGFTIVMVAICIVVLFAFAALAVDLGVLYTARTSAQHAADAAALAGAYTFISPGVVQPTAATNAAIAVAAQNRVMGQTVAITAANVLVDEPNRRVTVTVPRVGANGIETFFAKVIGWNSVDVQTVATAEAAREGSASHCIKPIYIPNTILSTLDPDAACTAKQVIFTNNQYSTWFLGIQSTLWGTEMKVRPSDPAKALAPGQFYSLDFGAGGATYRCAWGQCLNYCSNADEVACGQPYPLKTGDMVGPTKQGVDDLIGNSPDTWGGRTSDGQYYFYPGGDTSVRIATSPSVTIAPVWDNCAQPVSPGYHGQAINVVGFMTMFVEGTQGKDVLARFMGSNVCPANTGGAGGGGGGAGGGTPVAGPLGVPVRLVQTTN